MNNLFYDISPSLDEELRQFEQDVNDFIADKINPIQFKAIRVAHGVYEQRQPGTHMLRIRCPAGAISPNQLKKVAELGKMYGSGEVHFTTRAEVQIHDLLIENVIPAIRELLSVGLSSRGGGGNTIRNILTSPYSGISSDEVFDVDPYAIALTTRMINESDSWNLPRKFKIAFSNNLDDTAYTQTTCLGFVATQKNQQPGFVVYCAGGMGAKPMVGHQLLDFVPAEKAYQVTKAMKLMFDKYGNRKSKTTSRIKFLWKKLASEEFTKLFQHEYQQLKDLTELDLIPFPLQNGLTSETKKKSPPNTTSIDSKYFELWKKRFLTAQKQSGAYSVKLPLRLGDLLYQDAVKLSELMEPLGTNTIRCDRGQNILLRNIPENWLEATYNTIMSMEQTLVRFAPFFSNMINCTGAQTCKLGICLPRGLSDAIREQLVANTLDFDRLSGFRLNMSGCPNTCGMHHIAHLGFFGKVSRNSGDMFPAYNVLAGGKVEAEVTEYATKYGEVSAHYIPQLVADFLKHYLSKEDIYKNYYEYLAGEGGDILTKLCKKYESVPSFAEDPSYYTDFGAKKRLSLEEIGTAECSAGMFDMIGVDRKNIKEQLKLLKDTDNNQDKKLSPILYQILFSASRMLLVTRGLDAKSDEQIFSLFNQHFIKTNLIDEKFQTVVEMGKNTKISELNPHKNTIIDLASKIESLYKSMDDSLRFKN